MHFITPSYISIITLKKNVYNVKVHFSMYTEVKYKIIFIKRKLLLLWWYPLYHVISTLQSSYKFPHKIPSLPSLKIINFKSYYSIFSIHWINQKFLLHDLLHMDNLHGIYQIVNHPSMQCLPIQSML